ncbi:TIM barrel protein [Kaistia dalseonensis]|uniref:Hydroxypyruvate isomerase n=1 Tax=Kaistia dalseonensis TaxID=410840 RepID=A0ABU0HDB9_9HYPH|nr:TIM barrel protein [Kaistia dalseonensis]MCX5497672.1 TIM barrel protein [Kaistia dalseonensis]MDQ0440316.1 hydroxypyruvate isomerase [Kaistia dalseonensis]
MLRFSANLGFLWPELPLLDRIEAAGRAGFRAIELHWPYDVPAAAVAAACDAADIVLTGLNTAPGDLKAGEFGLGALPGREAEFEAAVTQSIAYCRATGATMIHAMAGVVPFDARSSATFVANLRHASAEAERAGLTLLIEPINPRDKPGYFYSTIEQAAEILERIGTPNVKLLFDVYHVGVATGDVLTRLTTFMPLIGHVQIAAVPSRAEPDEGEISYPAIFLALEELGYEGWIGCEYKPRGDTVEGLVWTERLGVTL